MLHAQRRFLLSSILICESELTLMEFLNMGGQLIERDTLDRTLPLVPYFQLQFLHQPIIVGAMEFEGSK